MTPAAERSIVRLLTAQSLAFGITLALLVVPANSLFLDAYGAKWLPATYVAIAIVGTLASAAVARAARRTRLVRVASASLAALVVLYTASWVVLVAGGAWVSALLLVLFPIALQMGFVFIGGQAGRLLDVRQMKERFPRILTGFSAGFLTGGLLGIPLLAVFGSTEYLLLAAAVAELAFLGLLLVTENRFPEVRVAGNAAGSAAPRRSARAVFTSRFVVLLLAFQVLGSMGAQVADYLFFNRARAHFSGDDLTRMLSGYTALLNVVALLFLALVAGKLMRRFGLRLGLVLNAAVMTTLLAITGGAVAFLGAGAFGVLALAAATQIANIALTDGTTRTSVNASFQVVPIEERLAVQAVVEGIGVPVAIGVTGAALLALNLLGVTIGGVIAFGSALAAIWLASGFATYRSYTRALADEMRPRARLMSTLDAGDDDSALHALLRSDDVRDVRLGLDLLPPASSPSAEAALHEAAAHADPEVRVRALAQLAASGDAGAAEQLEQLAVELAGSAEPADRAAAAGAVASRRDLLVGLLDDPERAVRRAALQAVVAEDADRPEVCRRVVSALDDPRTAGSGVAALQRLGDPAVPLIAAAVARPGHRVRPPLLRAAAAAAAAGRAEAIEPALHDRDRSVVLAALEALDTAGGGPVVPASVLDGMLRDASAHAARASAAAAVLTEREPELDRALDDELVLARRLAAAALACRYGRGARDAIRVVDHAEGQRRALGIEALDVLISREEAEIALPLLRGDAGAADSAPARTAGEWIADMRDDPEGAWRSEWVALCAREAAART